MRTSQTDGCPRLEPWEIALVVLLAVILAWIYAAPLSSRAGTYLTDTGDPMQHLSVARWTSEKLLSGHWGGMWDVPPIFYPSRHPLAAGDPQFGTTIMGLPLFAATGNIVLAYNFGVLLSIPLCAVGAYALARALTRSRAAGLVAMMAWGLGMWHSGQANHQQILSLEALPFLLLAIHRYGETQKRRYLVGMFAAWLAQEFLAEYWGGFLLLLVAPFTVGLLLFTYRLPMRRTALALAVIALAVLPWLIAQRPLLAETAGGRHHPRAEIVAYSADLADYLPARGTFLWRNMGFAHITRWDTLPDGEFQLSPGILVLLLAGVAGAGAFRRRVRSPHLVRAAGADSPAGDAKWRIVKRAAPLAGGIFVLLFMLTTTLGMNNLEIFGIPEWLYNNYYAGAIVCLCVYSYVRIPLLAFASKHGLEFRNVRSPETAYIILAAVTIIWSCGYQIHMFHVAIMGGVHEILTRIPATRSVRFLCRMGIIADLALALLGAYGFARIWSHWLRHRTPGTLARGLVLTCVCAVIWMENVPARGTVYAHSKHIPGIRAIDRWLAMQPRRPMVELPLTILPYLEGERLWNEMTNRMPMRNGCETFYPDRYYSDVRLLGRPESPEAIARLRSLGIYYVLLDTDNRCAGQTSPAGVTAQMPARLGQPYVQLYRDGSVIAYALPPTTPRH